MIAPLSKGGDGRGSQRGECAVAGREEAPYLLIEGLPTTSQERKMHSAKRGGGERFNTTPGRRKKKRSSAKGTS